MKIPNLLYQVAIMFIVLNLFSVARASPAPSITQGSAHNGLSLQQESTEKELRRLVMKAAVQGNIKSLQTLLSQGVNPNFKSSTGFSPSYNHKTPLMVAARNGHATCVNLLLNYGADVNADSHTRRKTALMYAAKYIQCLEILISHGAILDQVNVNQETALMYAARAGSANCVKALLFHGADVHHTNDKGYGTAETALSIAEQQLHEAKFSSDQKKYQEVVTIIKNHILSQEQSKKRAAGILYKSLLHAMYRPGGEGYIAAKDHFESLMNQQK